MATDTSFEARDETYASLWDGAQVKPDRKTEVDRIADRIIANRATYETIERTTGVPWFWQGPVHYRESSLRFDRHLHEGSPLTGRTVNVPKGRPKTGSPPFTFAESAIDALTMDGHKLQNVTRWSVERGLWEWERYNGFGSMRKGIASSYVWGGTTKQQPGKWVRDHVWDSTVMDKQLGTAAILKCIAAKCPDVAERLKDREASPPKEVIKTATKNQRRATKAGAVTGAAGGGGAQTGTVQPDKPVDVITPVVGYTVMGIGIAVALVAAVLWAKRVSLIKSKWGA